MKYRKNIFYKIRRIPAMLGLTALTAVSCHDKPMVIEKEVDPIIKRDTTYIPKPDTTYLTQIDTTYIPVIDTLDARRIDTIITKKNDVVFAVRGCDHPDELQANVSIETLQEYANCDTVNNIYLVPSPLVAWNWYNSNRIQEMRQLLQERLNVSPKIHGRGDFNFRLRAASEIPTDSLWFVQNGWTINKGR